MDITIHKIAPPSTEGKRPDSGFRFRSVNSDWETRRSTRSKQIMRESKQKKEQNRKRKQKQQVVQFPQFIRLKTIITSSSSNRNVQAAQETIASLTAGDNAAYEMDVSSGDSVDAVLNEVIGRYKRPPTVVVNSAGITRDNFLLKMPESDFDAVINVNLKGTWLVLQRFGRAMIDHELAGSMVNVSSIVARTGNIGQSNYSPSKAGVEAMT
ncbi:estradiol 17-beta-dehydrogenase 8-like [Anopheles merus]|uniref:estradiol 17-beta-dehydrogenase 8-like n=1 Tax=Anopheles merus TaxID=30066 RepID=UPI001BE473B9|nr:estradiol 17-beta-dehydrogenase 8-like [Anopheles merus]XP_041787822.1 estradiol 17-beta-dehydrogenase 8-like [Anopheles merus]